MTLQRAARVVWILWLIAIIIVSIPWFLFHVDIFYTIDPRLYRLLLIALPSVLAAGAVYCRIRIRTIWRYELVGLIALPMLFGAIYAPLAAVVVAWIAAVAFGTGSVILGLLELKREPGASGLIGFGVLSCLLFFLGVAGAYYTWAFLVLLLAMTLVCSGGILQQYKEIRRWHEAWGRCEPLREAVVGAAVFGAFLLVTLACLAWLTPAWNGDSIRFHVPLVRSHLWSHSLAVFTAIPYGYFPQGFEVIALLAWALGGQSAAQAISPLFFLLAIVTAFSLAEACGIERKWAVAGLALAATIPFLHWSGVMFKNDLLMAAYELGALLSYLRWREERNFRWIVVGTFLTSMSFGVKHVAVFGAFPIAFLYLFASWQQKRRLLSMLVLVVVFASSGLLWHARTYLATHNLVYPQQIASAVSTAHAETPLFDRLLRYVHIPYWMYTEGKRHFESPSPQPAGIVLLLGAPLWLLRPESARQRRDETILWIFILLYYLYWGSILSVLRYAIAPIVLLALLAAARLSDVPRRSVPVYLTAAFVFSLPILLILEMAPAQIPLFLKRTDAAGFLRVTLPPFAVVEQLGHYASDRDSVASVGNWAVAYAPNPALFEHVYKTEREYRPDDVRQILRPNSRFLILPNAANLKELEAAALPAFELERLYEDREFLLYRLRSRLLTPP